MFFPFPSKSSIQILWKQKSIDQTFPSHLWWQGAGETFLSKQRCTEKAHWILPSHDHQISVCVQYERAWHGVYCECFCVHISISSGCTVSHLLPVFGHLSVVLKMMKCEAMDSSGCWSHGKSMDASFPPATNALFDRLSQAGLFLLISY